MPTRALDALTTRLVVAGLTTTRPDPYALDVHAAPDRAPFARVTTRTDRPVLTLTAPDVGPDPASPAAVAALTTALLDDLTPWENHLC